MDIQEIIVLNMINTGKYKLEYLEKVEEIVLKLYLDGYISASWNCYEFLEKASLTENGLSIISKKDLIEVKKLFEIGAKLSLDVRLIGKFVEEIGIDIKCTPELIKEMAIYIANYIEPNQLVKVKRR